MHPGIASSPPVLSAAASSRRADGILHLPDALPGGDGGVPRETRSPGEGRAARPAGTPRLPGDARADRQRGAAGRARHAG